MTAHRPFHWRITLAATVALLTLGAPAPHASSSSGQATSTAPQAGPQRIISLVPAVTEMLFAMGSGPQVVGVSSYDSFPSEVKSRPSVGALIDPDFERILSLRPDLVVVYSSQQDLIERLGRARIPIFDYRHAGLPDIAETIEALSIRVGRAEAGRQLAARLRSDITAIAARVGTRNRPKTALVFGREPASLRSIYVSAGVGFMHDMLVVAGGIDVFEDVQRQSLQVSTEMMLARAPEVIIEVHPSNDTWTPARIASERQAWSVLPSVPAVRTGRVHILADDRLSIPGPRVGEAIRLLAAAIHPEIQ